MKPQPLSAAGLAVVLVSTVTGVQARSPQKCVRYIMLPWICPLQQHQFYSSFDSSPAVTNARISSNQCALLAKQEKLAGRVYSAESGEYVAQQATYWSLDNALRAPKCIVLPQSAEEVAVAVKTLTVAGNSRCSPSCQFAIRGAGHMQNGGANNIHDGVTIDMGKTSQLC